MAALSHPNVIAIFDTGLHESQLYVVMELLSGLQRRWSCAWSSGADDLPRSVCAGLEQPILKADGSEYSYAYVKRLSTLFTVRQAGR